MAGHVRTRTSKDGKTVTYQARIPDPSRGGTCRITKTFRTKREAVDWIAQQRASILDGTHVDPRLTNRPFDELVESWKATWIDLSPTTVSGYDSALRNHLLPVFGGRKIGTITRDAVQRYVTSLSQRDDMRAGTVRSIYSVLRNVMSHGVRSGIIKATPCVKIKLPPQPREEMLCLTPEEVRALAEGAPAHYRTYIYTAAYTGLRAGEIRALRIQDVDLSRGVIHVRRSFREVKGVIHIGDCKTRNSRRTITLPTFLRTMLDEHISNRAGGSAGPDDLVFTTRRGLPIRHNLFYQRIYKKAVRATLPADKHRLRFHDLRHTCASLLIAQGAHPKMISARLGHSSIQVTIDRYGHVFPSVEESLADALDDVFAAAQPDPERGQSSSAAPSGAEA